MSVETTKSGRTYKSGGDLKTLARQSLAAVREANISNEGSLVFKAAVIALFTSMGGAVNVYSIAKRFGFPERDVHTIYNNWSKNNLLINKRAVIEINEGDSVDAIIISITLTALAGAGEIVRVEHFTLPPLTINNQLLLPNSTTTQ